MQTISTFNAFVRLASTFGIWGWVDISAALLVSIGCVGEWWLLLKNHPKEPHASEGTTAKQHHIEGTFVTMVAIGVAFPGATNSQVVVAIGENQTLKK
jgi:hypothetical protein